MKTWEGQKGWTYRTYALNEDASDLSGTQPVLDLWRSKTVLPRLPAWGDFEFPDFAGWHANIILYEVLRNPFDLLYRICGSNAALAYGSDLTGKTMLTGAV